MGYRVFIAYAAVLASAVTAAWEAREAFPGLTFDNPTELVGTPDGKRLFVAEREGRIYSFENRNDAETAVLVLDIRARTQGEWDCGLLGLALHPEFDMPGSPNRGHFYIHYTYAESPVVGRRPPADMDTRIRLSRFTIPEGSLVADPGSEFLLIDQLNEHTFHNGGGMFFHPQDGFLYVSSGDEADPGNCQVIDRDLFSGILRIDVDQRGGAVSHPIARQPATGTTQGYFIPSDNPWAGRPGVLEEFYAVGFRSPHRISVDPETGVIWAGEVGNSRREEINAVVKGGNYQWPAREGKEPGESPAPAETLGTWMDPFYAYGGGSRACVIGGHVYRGCRNAAELGGKYIFADFLSGDVLAADFEVDPAAGATLAEVKTVVQLQKYRNYPRITGSATGGLTSFGVDAAGEMYLLTLGDKAKILELLNENTRARADCEEITTVRHARQRRAVVRGPSGARMLHLPTPGPASLRLLSLDGSQLAVFLSPGPSVHLPAELKAGLYLLEWESGPAPTRRFPLLLH